MSSASCRRPAWPAVATSEAALAPTPGEITAAAERRKRVLNWVLLAPALAMLTFTLLMPLLIVFRNAVFPTGQPGFSLFYFEKFLSDPYYLGVLWRTFRLGVIATVVTLVPGYVLAHNIALHPNARWRMFAMIVTLVPLVVQLIIRVFGWLAVLSPNGTVNSFLRELDLIESPLRLLFTETAMMIGFVHSHLYFMVLPIAATLMKIDPNLLRASENLGATPTKTFLNVILPLSMPGVVSGCLICFALNISDFVAPSVLGGNRNRMMTYTIFEQQLYVANQHFAAAATVILMAAAALAIAGAFRAATAYGRRFGT